MELYRMILFFCIRGSSGRYIQVACRLPFWPLSISFEGAPHWRYSSSCLCPTHDFMIRLGVVHPMKERINKNKPVFIQLVIVSIGQDLFSITDRIFPAGSANHAIVGPLSLKIPLASVLIAPS